MLVVSVAPALILTGTLRVWIAAVLVRSSPVALMPTPVEVIVIGPGPTLAPVETARIPPWSVIPAPKVLAVALERIVAPPKLLVCRLISSEPLAPVICPLRFNRPLKPVPVILVTAACKSSGAVIVTLPGPSMPMFGPVPVSWI